MRFVDLVIFLLFAALAAAGVHNQCYGSATFCALLSFMQAPAAADCIRQ